MTLLPSTVQCQICFDEADGLHFTVNACRACAAFFRRTVALDLRYECRFDGKCHIEKSMRNMCRSCRLKKCLEVGMQTSGIYELRSSNFDSSKKVCQLEAHLITDIVNTYFYPFDKLQFTQKAILFKNFFCYLSHTDRAYQSYRLFGQDESNDRLLMPDGGIIKSSELETFYANARGVHSQPTDAAKVFRPSMEFILNVIIPYMRRIQLTEIEYVAILGFLLWNEAVADISRDTIAIIHLTKDSLLDELHEHYQCMGMEGHQITKRIGQLMLLLPHLTRSVVMLRENSELAELFNIFEADICCKSFKAGSYAMEPQP
uniref:Nuclear receptor domain-containing protein n=1 Tax=Angiostrongylus cantonensis TaxID=6313 RepID=A0A0K0D1E1_ANGCA